MPEPILALVGFSVGESMTIETHAENWLRMMDEYKGDKLVRESQAPQAKLIRAMLKVIKERT
jgi:hypothetical protein